MQPDVEKAWVRAQRIISRVRTNQNLPVSQKNSSNLNKSWKSLNEKLDELYVEQSKKELKYKNFRSTSHLLKKLVQKDKLNFLVVNLYPGNDGYSLLLKSGNDVHSETLRLPYEESEFLQCIDNRDLPPIIIDLLEQAEINLFYCGCVIVEIRDCRRSSPGYVSEYVLLKPNLQTLIADLNVVTSDSQQWSYEDKQQLESAMLLATQEPLCLDPSIAVTFVANHIQHEVNSLNYLPIKKNIKRYGQVAINRRRKLNQLPAPSNLKLHDFIKKRNSKSKLKKTAKPPVDTWQRNPVNLSPPDAPVEIPNISLPEKPNNTPSVTLDLVEEYILEAERKEGKIYYTKLTVHRRTLDDVYIGELYVDRDYITGQTNGATCQFILGSKLQVVKYINQFREIFTEEGRKAVKITHVVPGQPSKVSFTQGMRDKAQNDVEPSSDTNVNKTSTQGAKDTSVANTVGSSSLISLVSNLDASKNLATSRPSSASKNITRQMTSPGSVNRLRVETCKSSQTASLPSYSQALSGTIKSSIRSTPFLKKSATDVTPVENIAIASSAEKSTLNNFGSGDIIVNHPASAVPCQNINSSMNIASFPQSISLQNIARVPHLQVSLTAMPQGLAVPISIAMVDPSQTSGVIVSTAAGSNIIACTSPSSTTRSRQTLSIATTSSLAPTVLVSSGMVNAQSSVISAPTNVVSLPVGVASTLNTQNLTTQLMATGLKGTTSGFRTSTGGGLSLLQVSGTQQQIPVFNQVSSPVLATAGKSMVSCMTAGGSSTEGGSVQQPLLTLTPPQQQLQFALQKQQFQQLQQQLQIQQTGTSKVKTQKRTILKPHK